MGKKHKGPSIHTLAGSNKNWNGPYQRTPSKLLELLDTQVFSGSGDRGSVRWRFLGMDFPARHSWNFPEGQSNQTQKTSGRGCTNLRIETTDPAALESCRGFLGWCFWLDPGPIDRCKWGEIIDSINDRKINASTALGWKTLLIWSYTSGNGPPCALFFIFCFGGVAAGLFERKLHRLHFDVCNPEIFVLKTRRWTNLNLKNHWKVSIQKC